MRRRVTAPDGTDYAVVLDWFGRRLRNPVELGRERAGRVWRANPFSPRRRPDPKPDAEARTRESRSSVLDLLDCGWAVDDTPGAGILLAVVGVALVVLAVLVGAPLLAAVLSVVVEYLALVVVASLVLLGRVLARRPWRIVVTAADGRSWVRHQPGWRRSRAEVRRIADSLGTGAEPTWLQLAPMPRPA